MTVGLLYHIATDFVKTFSASAALAGLAATRLAKLGWQRILESRPRATWSLAESNVAWPPTFARPPRDVVSFCVDPRGSAHASRPLTMFIAGVEPGGTCSEAC